MCCLSYYGSVMVGFLKRRCYCRASCAKANSYCKLRVVLFCFGMPAATLRVHSFIEHMTQLQHIFALQVSPCLSPAAAAAATPAPALYLAAISKPSDSFCVLSTLFIQRVIYHACCSVHPTCLRIRKIQMVPPLTRVLELVP